MKLRFVAPWLLAWAVASSGCRKAPEAPPAAPASVSTADAERDRPTRAASPDAGEVAAAPTLNPRYKKKTLPIFVGGCRERCREPRAAFGHFLRAVEADPAGEGVIPFLNTAELIVNGEAHGEVWARLWIEGKWPERQRAIESFTSGFLSWYRELSDPDEFDDAVRNGVQVLRDESEVAIIGWRRPHIEGSLTAARWRFVFEPRGLEWLIVEVDQYTGEAHAR